MNWYKLLKEIEALLAGYIVFVGMWALSFSIGGWWLGVPMFFVALDVGTMVSLLVLNFDLIFQMGAFMSIFKKAYARYT